MAFTSADVALWLDVELNSSEFELMDRVVAAVSARIIATHNVPAGPLFDLPAIMQCGRLWQRRFTPGGIATFGPDIAIRVTRFDPDIAEAIEPWANLEMA